jgi:organic radical activating enzyme
MYQSLIIFLNRRCTVACQTCNVDAVPHNTSELSPSWLTSFFSRVQEGLDFSGYILWTGGEPFLSFPSLLAGIGLAHDAGYHSEILTSCIWFERYPQYLEQLILHSRPTLRISLDAEHQKAVPIEQVIACIREALQLGFEVNFTLREIPGQAHSPQESIQQIKKQLPQFYQDNMDRSRWLHHIPHIPVAKGITKPVCASSPGDSIKEKPCFMAHRDMVIGEDGLIYPCCGFFGMEGHQKMAISDPMLQDWESITAITTKSALAKEPFFTPCDRCIERFAS